ncbi:rho GTPase-activating protein gacU [Eupeodes corollae]|uniref:rho GTPase-activating protein gacU n=1 Tax=Eupeodes corollae TaxID=290404 RepID=UPI002492FD87|nr:rho GTPase-activating protein gacU [Eupeodes corollae]
MTDCSSSIQGSMCSTMSDAILSARSAMVSNPRIRVIRLVRPNSRRILVTPDNNVTFGFAIRGGKEFGTGFFVSRVEKSSEADIKGLRVGDQIIRVNGYHVDDAVHKEFTQFVSSQDRLTLKVRGVAMLPMKDNQCDPISWHIVARPTLASMNPIMDEYSVGQKDARIVLKVAPRTKLGLGICKGPEWKPGIFVQFTKDYSVARDAGLRPGDQILSVNSIDFSDVLFSEAVAVMKSSSTLEMVVRSGAGLDLFPGESSGYNSSASSVTGDQSPCWADQSAKRLSSVREEPLSAKSHWHDRRKNPPLTSALQSSASSSCSSATVKDESNKTIIQLSESGTLINNTMVASHDSGASTSSSISSSTSSSASSSSSASMCDDSNLKLNFIMPPDQANPHHHQHQLRTPSASQMPPPPPPTPGDTQQQQQQQQLQLQHANSKIADICFVSRQSETKTVIVEVHRSATDKSNPKGRAPSPPKPPPPSLPELQLNCVTASNSTNNNNNKGHNRTPSIASSSMSIPGSISGTSLCSAISEELKKRRERTSNDNNRSENGEFLLQQRQPPRRIGNGSNCADDERRHSALMDEFKRAHKRMFRNGFKETDRMERQSELRKTAMMQDEVDHRSSNCNVSKSEYNNLISSSMQNDTNGYYPTPPPPPQFANKSDNYNQHRSSPPSSPAPDYSHSPVHTLTRNSKVPFRNGTLTRTDRNNEAARANGDHAELESIDSYQMRNPSSTIPRPPSLYFAPQNSGPPTMKKNKRPVSVTIGEYSSVPIVRKEPSKMEFIAAKSPENGHYEEPMASDLLRSELEQTLSRSNLKKRNEEKNNNNYNNINNNNNNNNDAADQKLEEATSELQNIILRQRSPNGSAYGKSVLQKTQSSNIEKLTQMLQNRQSTMYEGANGGGTLPNPARVTISVPNNNHAELRKTESNPSTHQLMSPTTMVSSSNNTASVVMPPMAPPPMVNGNGILKNGSAYSRSSYSSSEKSISFGN